MFKSIHYYFISDEPTKLSVLGFWSAVIVPLLFVSLIVL